ncbi:hypothetical protein [Nonomuraea sp. NPDC049695]|uniref:hypothetical protein n=1 Tax=Nonomuraea sp. NPDC049695 TaxID=3154734 RepID=UPI0034369FD0
MKRLLIMFAAGAAGAAGVPLAVTRELCRYPSVSRYTGHGDPADAGSYYCARRPWTRTV